MFDMLLRAGTAFALLLAPAAWAKEPATTNAKPALWVVKDEDTTVYLFGTVHLLKPGLSWFDKAVKEAFDASGELVIEMVAPDDAAMQGIMLTKAVNAAGPGLSEKLSAADRAPYYKALAGLGLQRDMFERFDPWAAAITLQLLPLNKLGYDPASGVEQVLTKAAEADGKKVVGLETAEQQLGYMDGLSEQAQVVMLTETVKEIGTIGTTMDKMVKDWSRGDADALAALINDSLKTSPELSKTLLTDRNARWAQWIGKRMETPGTVFVAVGAGHLAGKGSVQEQLAKAGLNAKRVRY